MIEERSVSVDGMWTRYLTAGDRGPEIVLLHGLGLSADIWERNIPALARGFRVYAPDLPGHGFTDKPDVDYSPSFFVEFARGFLRAIGAEKPVLIGTSMGGGICIRLAVEDGERVGKVILANSSGLGADVDPLLKLGAHPLFNPLISILPATWQGAAAFLFKMVFNPCLVTPRLVAFYRNISAEIDTVRAFSRILKAGCTIAMEGGDKFCSLQAGLGRIAVPTLLIWGWQDTVIPVIHAFRAERLIPAARLNLIHFCGHLSYYEQPASFNRHVLNFLQA